MKQQKSKQLVLPGNFKFPKSLTGIKGLDDIMDGGFPQGRTTMLLGGQDAVKQFLQWSF